MSEAVEHVRDTLTPRESESRPATLLLYRIVTPLSWLLLLVTTSFYSSHAPTEGTLPRHTIWGQNRLHHTPFALNAIIISIYWIVLYLVQIPYLYNLFTPDSTVAASVALAPAFTAHNLLAFGFVNLWCRSHFGWALLLAAIDWLNLTFAYFRNPKSPVLHHVGVVAGPLAFAFVTLFWDGAAAVNATHLPARIVANVFIWTWAVYGGFYLVTFKDWSFGLCLSVLTAALGVAQFLTVIVAIQWIFAFTIMALLFVGSVVVAFPEATGIQSQRGQIVSEDRERAPLLANEDA